MNDAELSAFDEERYYDWLAGIDPDDLAEASEETRAIEYAIAEIVYVVDGGVSSRPPDVKHQEEFARAVGVPGYDDPKDCEPPRRIIYGTSFRELSARRARLSPQPASGRNPVVRHGRTARPSRRRRSTARGSPVRLDDPDPPSTEPHPPFAQQGQA